MESIFFILFVGLYSIYLYFYLRYAYWNSKSYFHEKYVRLNLASLQAMPYFIGSGSLAFGSLSYSNKPAYDLYFKFYQKNLWYPVRCNDEVKILEQFTTNNNISDLVFTVLKDILIPKIWLVLEFPVLIENLKFRCSKWKGFEGLHTRLVTKDAAEAYLISSQINVFVID